MSKTAAHKVHRYIITQGTLKHSMVSLIKNGREFTNKAIDLKQIL
jgi:hypothetical protein